MQNVFQNEKSTATQMVKTAINIVNAYHESQLEKFNTLLKDDDSKEFITLVENFQQFLEHNETVDSAFSAFLVFLSE